LADFLRVSLGGSAWRSWIASGDASGRLVANPLGTLVPALTRLLLPVLAGTALLTVAAGLLQTGFLFRPGRIAPDVARINPLAGLSRVFSGASAARLVFGVFKIGVVAAVAFADLWSRREELVSLASLDVAELAARASDVCLGTCFKVGVALLALSAIDYLYQRSRLARELKMTPREMREEMREFEGHPQVAARRRELRRIAGVTGGRQRPVASSR
jgi:flagellar biosynthetic protein FlhB